MEADLAVFDDPGGLLADRISGAIGELSSFDQTFGYHADRVGVETAVLPAGWRERLVVFAPPDAEPGRGLCLEPHDCVVSKLVAARPKDLAFADALVSAGLVHPRILLERIELLDDRVRSADRERVRMWVGHMLRSPTHWRAPAWSATSLGRLAYHVLDIMESLLASACSGRSVDISSSCERPAPVALGGITGGRAVDRGDPHQETVI